MGSYYDEIEIEDMVWDDEKRVYHYPCPCGDRFEISRHQLADCEDIATCPSCSLIIRVIYDPLDFEDEPPDDDDSEVDEAEDDDEEEEEEDDEEEVEEDDDDDAFKDALETLTLDETPNTVAVSA